MLCNFIFDHAIMIVFYLEHLIYVIHGIHKWPPPDGLI